MPNIAALHEIYATDPNALSTTINDIYDRIECEGLNPVWIALIPREKTLARIQQLSLLPEGDRRKLPLFGIPFAVKDNMDVAGLGTAAACPTFARTPATESAPVVVKLEQAGAILVGKTNMDQFATGLVGTRTPYGVCASVFNSNYISGGSSSGSAVAVASGLVTFALGTDTAGSGRIPAMFNNVIGLKPTRGLLSTCGVVPACRTLDCVSILTETASDASIVLAVARGFDELDPYSRVPSASSGAAPWSIAPIFRFAIPTLETREFFGDVHNPTLFQKAIDVIKRDLGGEPVDIDLTPFLAAGNLLYKGPWVAERYTAVGQFIEQHAKDIDPTVYTIITKAKDYTAVDTFNGVYELERLKKKIHMLWKKFDILLVPTAPRTYTIDEIAKAPIERNSHLGYYTNFVNLLDLAAISVPAGIRPDGLPFGVTLIGAAFTDTALLLLGDRIHRALATNLGGSTRPLANTPKLLPTECNSMSSNCFLIAVVGAHLSGQPLNYQLTERNARLVRTCRTRHDYQLYVLKGSVPLKPGLVRVTDFKGPGIELEIWALPADGAPSFISMVPPPLSIGNIFLEDGCIVKGFLVEPSALDSTQDITHMGGWRAYLDSMNLHV
ncbi:unnamed protein product [Rotaria sordida]|uniref:Allophanate hydrolase n=1 Tax=Rotaria sordida TaxID=392033 RepID=A0A819BC47_9BILA|nr:unnamed protein product [Rotaria sordida]CAF1194107.1 unnamed protein product [Rotaria sordida]CAF3665593.1 unnamed protein product [Rotaria sordida]CAF3800881.1 unnamed protein product [Rotaria sordida]